MLEEPKCFTRRCKFYNGVDSEEEEENERNVCKAFPDGIPDEITYGDNLHLAPYPEQKNEITYEKKQV
jgi:hypothetical protein